MVLTGAEAAPWGFCNRARWPAWLTALAALDPRAPKQRHLARRVLFWRSAEAARIQHIDDLPLLGPPARLSVAIRAR